MDPFFQEFSRRTVIHVRVASFSDSQAPFIRSTVLGLSPFFHNVVLARSSDCQNPNDVCVEVHTDSSLLRNPASCRSAAAWLRRKYPYICAVVGHMGNGTRAARFLAQFLNVPLLGIFGGTDVNVESRADSVRRAYEEVFRWPSSYIVAVAHYLRGKLLEIGAPAERTFVWHRGVDLAGLAAPSRQGMPRKLVLAARFHEVKGHEYAIRAIAGLLTRGIRAELYLLGDGPLRRGMESLAQELAVQELVHFVGRVPHGHVMDYLCSADIYLHPSIRCAEGRIEGIPNAIMEAHATELPVVATRHGGIPEVVLDGKSGFLVPEGDVDAMVDKLSVLMQDRELCRRMGAAGREHVTREFNLATQSRRLAATILHMTQAADILGQRGWPLHAPIVSTPAHTGTGQNIQSPSPMPASVDRFNGLLHPHFRSDRRILGWLVTLCKQLAYKLVIRPYLKAIQLNSSIWQAEVAPLDPFHIGVAGLAREVVAMATSDLSMSTVMCADCPHYGGASWPPERCPLDEACLRTLQMEFSKRPFSPIAADDCEQPGERSLRLVDDDLPVSGVLPYADALFDRVVCHASLQGVQDPGMLFRHLRRILRPQGRLVLEIGPLYRGRCGGQLIRRDLVAPFALLLFAPELLDQSAERPVSSLRAFGPNDIRQWALKAGLVEQRQWLPAITDNPCEIELQARFASLLHRAAIGSRELLPAYVARLGVARSVATTANLGRPGDGIT